MTRTKLDKRFFNSTRGRIVSLLRTSKKTVNQLSAELELTDNAVRAHLLSLERDGLVRQGGVERGTRKPHFAYELTEEAEGLYPKAYDALLNQLITVLKGRLSSRALKEVLREVGSSLGGELASTKPGEKLEHRLSEGLKAMESIGGSVCLDKEEGKLLLRGGSCPLATAVNQHPEVCQLAESLLSEIIKTTVTERCDRQGAPRCLFEISQKKFA
jgi:predicted ArsR family transcriptional regulator